MTHTIRKRTKIIFACLSMAALGVLGLHADTATLPAVADTFIVNLLPDNNSGANTWFDVGTDGGSRVRRGLLKFDLSSLPPGAIISSATLRLTILKVPPTAGPASTVDLLRLQNSWGEGVQSGNSGSPAAAGEATWNARFNGSQNWTAPGAGSDIVQSSNASATVSSTVGDTIAWSGAGVLADVQFWYSHASQNFGWLLASRSESVLRTVRGFESKESGNAPPVLEVVYTAPNRSPVVSISAPAAGAAFPFPTPVTIHAQASDPDGTVTQVEFFDGGASLGVVMDPGFAITNTLFPGSHSLTAVATDDRGASSTSAVVNVSITSQNFADPIPARIPKGNITIELKPIADGMVSPLGMAMPDDGTERVFVYDQIGVVWLVTTNGRSPTPVLDLRTRLVNLNSSYDERGLLGLAVHPNFAQHPFLYTYTSEPSNGPADFATSLPAGVTNDHQSVIAEWALNPSTTNQVDVATRREIMRIDEPESNHNAGTMRFGPDGFLYFTLGDGGQADDVGNGHSPGGNGQDTNNILGSLVRIDVDGANSANGKYGVPIDNPFVGGSGVPEIYAYGFRNPFNFSFDRTNGQLYLADVGQNNIEEVDIVTKGGNYGWNIKEGTFFFVPGGGYVTNFTTRPVPPDLIDPIAEYDHDDGSAVIGGFVYRGAKIPELAGRYVFGDWGNFLAPSGRLFYLDESNAIKELRIGLEDRPLGYYLKGFGENTSGELFVFASKTGPGDGGGIMYKIVPPPAAPLGIVAAGVTNGTNFQVTLGGGIGPFAQQRKLRLDEPYCMTELVISNNTAVTPVRGASGFFRHVDTARHPAVPFTASLSGANERPVPLSNSATGFAIISLEGSTLRFTITYSGLSGPPTLAHFHGPSTASSFGGVLIDLRQYHTGPFSSTSGSFSGAIVLNDAQKTLFLRGLTYVNVHTTANPGGEMRGQVAPVNFQASLLDAYETPDTATGARGFGSFTLIGNQLGFNIAYRGLSGAALAAHIHGPAGIGQPGNVMIDLAPFNGGAFGTSSVLSGSVTLDSTQFAALVDGQTYVNFHTPNFGNGELRGQILPQATAIPFTAWISGTNERPALINGAGGLGLFSLEGSLLTFNITYTGLSGPPINAHIHGPAVTTNSTGVQVPLMSFANGALGTSGCFSGSTVLTADQRKMLLAGQCYFNIHTSANSQGEARGNIAPVLMSAFATGSAERLVPITSGGSALGLFTLVSTQLNLSIVYSGLSGTVSASHIHAPSTPGATASVVVDFSRFNGGAYGSSGAVSGSTNLNPTVLNYMIDNLGYMNFHTARNGGGEIRGQVTRP